MSFKAAVAGVSALFWVMAPTAGHAINTTYYFTVDGSSGDQLGGDLPAPGYGSVTVTTVGSDLKFQLQMAPNWFVDTGNATVHHPVAFNLATSGLKISATAGFYTPLSKPFSGVNAGGYTNPAFNGPFNYAINCAKNGAHGCKDIASLTFYVLNAGLLSPILTNGVFITADIYGGLTGKTGVVGATFSEVPGPVVGAGLPGLVMAFGGLIAWARRRRLSAPVAAQ